MKRLEPTRNQLERTRNPPENTRNPPGLCDSGWFLSSSWWAPGLFRVVHGELWSVLVVSRFITHNNLVLFTILYYTMTAQKFKFSIKDFFSKCEKVLHETVNFFAFNKEFLNGKFHFVCSAGFLVFLSEFSFTNSHDSQDSREGVGYFFESSLALPPASQTLRH